MPQSFAAARALAAALVLFAAAASASPNPEAAAALREGRAREQSQDPEGALAAYRKAISLGPDFVEAHRAYQKLLRVTGRGDQARAEYALRRERDPRSAVAQYLFGRVADSADREPAFRAATELDPGFYWGWFALGQTRLTARDASAAAACFRKALEIDPAAADAHVGLGEAQFSAAELNAALQSFRKAGQLEPSAGSAHLGAARCNQALENWADALLDLERILVGRPADLDALELAAQCANGASDWPRAEAYRTRARAAWRALPERNPRHAEGIVIDALPLAGGFMVVRERFAPDPTADAGKPWFVFEVFRADGTRPTARLYFVGATGDHGTLQEDVLSGLGPLWSPDRECGYPEIRRQAGIFAARRLAGK